MQINAKRGLNRAFVVFVVFWIIYCLLVYPVQKRQEALKVYDARLRDCSQELGKGQERLKGCLDDAWLISGADDWLLKTYYARESWLLLIVIVAVPLLAYGICRGALAVVLWVWHGFTSSP